MQWENRTTSRALVKGSARELDIDEGFLERLEICGQRRFGTEMTLRDIMRRRHAYCGA
jgi:hypothetical protein